MLKHFGTDGVRGVALITLTVKMAYRIGRSLGRMAFLDQKPVLVCEDTRLSGETLKGALIDGLLKSGAVVYDSAVSTTPSVSYLVKAKRFAYGVMISASHNPYGDNGIKVFNGEGEKLADDREGIIEEYMDREADDLPLAPGRLVSGDGLKEEYLAWLASKAQGGYGKARVLVDCANGSASALAPRLYEKLGVDAFFINAAPNGRNINDDCGSTHLEGLRKAYLEKGCDLGFAFDGDGDRFMAFGPGGRLIDGDALVFLGALYLREKKALKNDTVVITVMSNFGLRKALEEEGIAYKTVAVGDKNVQQALKKDGLSLGGEQSGHVIFLDDLNTGDGLLSSLKLLDIFVHEPALYRKIAEFAVYPQILKNVPFATREALEKAANDPALRDFVARQEASLKGQGRVLVRPSGTEPLLRVMAEASDEGKCAKAVEEIVSFIKGDR
ncbi:MAG: phosphoglucosamine mutase [Bacilli bacterium]|jgi:phosphoglucosamine mutase|nr:phosphoglucosamine mutase [Bacilli bacterium]